ncbi:hypothetical protein FS842_005999 [Serendipita sp. 407]|nr:hypothetical protein FS842_005999 [Serendipita sp. 407]
MLALIIAPIWRCGGLDLTATSSPVVRYEVGIPLIMRSMDIGGGINMLVLVSCYDEAT